MNFRSPLAERPIPGYQNFANQLLPQMEDCALANQNSDFNLRLFFLSLSAKGAVAMLLAVPVAVLLLAVAYRIVF